MLLTCLLFATSLKQLKAHFDQRVKEAEAKYLSFNEKLIAGLTQQRLLKETQNLGLDPQIMSNFDHLLKTTDEEVKKQLYNAAKSCRNRFFQSKYYLFRFENPQRYLAFDGVLRFTDDALGFYKCMLGQTDGAAHAFVEVEMQVLRLTEYLAKYKASQPGFKESCGPRVNDFIKNRIIKFTNSIYKNKEKFGELVYLNEKKTTGNGKKTTGNGKFLLDLNKVIDVMAFINNSDNGDNDDNRVFEHTYTLEESSMVTKVLTDQLTAQIESLKDEIKFAATFKEKHKKQIQINQIEQCKSFTMLFK